MDFYKGDLSFLCLFVSLKNVKKNVKGFPSEKFQKESFAKVNSKILIFMACVAF